jgi:hypothetical protein
MVTHFSLGSFFAIHGFSTSSFLTRLEWKYLEGRARAAEEEPKDDVGLELTGEEKGFPLGAGGEISSPNGLLRLSGVLGRICDGVVEVAEVALPL